jgi:speckle-type POZ protein
MTNNTVISSLLLAIKYFQSISLLSIRSNVFAAMFESDMIEKNEKFCKIDDIDSDVFEEFLTFLYTGKSEKIKSMAPQLVIAEEKYNINELKSLREDVINSNSIAIGILKLAESNNANKLVKKVIDFGQ